MSRAALPLVVILAACGGAGADAIPGSGAGAGIGTCHFRIVGPSGTRVVDLHGFAAMTADDLRAECGTPELSFINAPLTITFGDKKYSGPGEYVIDAQHTDGTFVFAADGDQYSAQSGTYTTTACHLTVVEGPAGPAAPGDRVRATFACRDLPEERGGILTGLATIDGTVDVVVPGGAK